MDKDVNNKEFVAFDTKVFTEEKNKSGGDPAKAVLGIIRARGENEAQDTASTHFPGRLIFVRGRDEAAPEFVAAAEKMGYVNTSEAHHPL